MLKFDTSKLKPADILAGRNIEGGKGIRAVLGSYTNHNALILNHSTRGMCIGDTVPPESLFVDLSKYEELIADGGYIVRIWRVRRMTELERQKVSDYWEHNCVGVDYPEYGVKRLWVFRLVNHLPWEIPGKWCSPNTLSPFSAVLPPERNPRTRPDGVMKLNPTPRTMENRLVAGILEDVTDQVLHD